MLKQGLLTTALAAVLLSPSLAAGAPTQLVPGVTYERQVQLIGGGPVVLHVVTAKPQGGLHRLRPVLSTGTVHGRRTVPALQQALSARATSVAVNGDLFSFANGSPSGAFVRDGVIESRPNPGRSALSIAFDGSLIVSKLRLAGSWTAGDGSTYPLREVNNLLGPAPGVGLFTRAYRKPTPRKPGAFDVVLTGFPKAVANGWLRGTVTAVRKGGGLQAPPGGAVLQARGHWRDVLMQEATIGTEVSVRLGLPDLLEDVADVIGGGPELVRNGVPVLKPDEGFFSTHLTTRHPRTAVGQRADGVVLLVVAEGRSSASIGLTHVNLARTMARLGAVTAMGLDGGGSSTLAFEGQVMNRISDGAPRAVTNALMLEYYGIYAPPTASPVLSPNGDGAADRKALSAKVVRRSAVDLRLVRPDGKVAWRFQGTVQPRWIRRTVGRPAMPEGSWRWVVEATETASGRTSSMERRFTVNRTLGHLKLSKQQLKVVPKKGGRLQASAVLTRAAKVDVTVRSSAGKVVRVLQRGQAKRGKRTWRWNGRNARGGVVATGRYTVRVEAKNGLGTVALAGNVRVVRAPGP